MGALPSTQYPGTRPSTSVISAVGSFCGSRASSGGVELAGGLEMRAVSLRPLLVAMVLVRSSALQSSLGSYSLRRLSRRLSSVASELRPELAELRSLAAETDRGQKKGADSKKELVKTLVTSLEATNTLEGSIDGSWELLYAEDDITRASPFFWAFRKAFKGSRTRLKLTSSELFADNVFYITDTIPFKSIGTCTQRIDLSSQSFVSQVRVSVDVAGRSLSSSLMTTSSTIRSTENRTLFEIQVDKTEVQRTSFNRM